MKKSKKSCTGAGCLKKGAINTGDLHLHTKGLFYVVKDDKVVSSTLRFCPSGKMCARNEKFISQCSTFSKHDSKKKPGLVDVEECARLQLEEFTVISLA